MTNYTPKGLLYAAKLAYPNCGWQLDRDGKTPFTVPVNTNKKFVLEIFDVSRDSDWVRLREALDKRGIQVVWNLKRKEWLPFIASCDSVSMAKFEAIYKFFSEDPRQLGLLICEVIAE